MHLFPLFQSPTALTILSGILCHITFNRLEPRNLPLILTLILLPPLALTAFFYTSHTNTLAALCISYTSYTASLLSSLILYRLSPFHPLASFPGPIICKVTRLWATYLVYTGNQHRYHRSLHARYGTHVRTGPNHLHICDADAIPTVLGQKGFPRGARYDVTKLPNTKGSLLSILDLTEHAHRRRIWDRGLNTKAVQGYVDTIERRVAQLVACLEKRLGEEVDLSFWLSCFSFDFMGDLAFGGAFKLMEQGADMDGYIRLTRYAIVHQELVGKIPWIKPMHHLLPSAKDIHGLQRFGKESVLARKAQGSQMKDIFYHLLDEEGIGSEPLSLPTLIMEATLAIVAGSDTTGTTLSTLFFHILTHPCALARLQSEIDATFYFPDVDTAGGTPFDEVARDGMPFLNAVIKETLRLQPAILDGVQRVVPGSSGGAMVAGRWIPHSTTVQIPAYSVHRDPRYFFPSPDAFIPERWLEPRLQGFKGGFVLNEAAFFPFSYGPMNCVGKNLATLELRMVTCALLHRFEFELVSESGGEGVESSLEAGYMGGKGAVGNEGRKEARGKVVEEWERGLKDGFLLMTGPLKVRVRERERGIKDKM